MRRTPFVAAAFTCLVFGSVLLAKLATAQIGPLGSEFQVNTTTIGGQGYSALASAADGSFVVVWTDPADDGNVKGQHYGSNGVEVGTEFQINTHTTGYQGRPAVGAAADGAFVVTWIGDSQDGDGQGVFAQRFDDAGTPAGTEFQVNTFTTGNQAYPSAAGAADGSFVIAWMGDEQDGNETGIFARRYDSAGTPSGTEFQVNTYTTEEQYEAQVASAADGRFAVTWSSRNQDGDGLGSFAQRYNSAGTAVGTEFQVNTYTTADQVAPAVAVAPDGALLIVWTGMAFNQDGDGSGIFGQRFTSAGLPAASEFQVNTYTTANQSYPPDVTATSSGHFIVVWRSSDQDGDDQGVFGQRYDSAGGSAGTEFQVNTHTTSAQWFANVAPGPSGSFVIVWQSDGQDGDIDGVFARRYGSAATCGNSTVDPGEQCDDGDLDDGDGCDSNCTDTACGNGIITLGEDCDDGNVANGDSCSSTCQDTAAPENTADPELTGGETISSDDGENDGATEEDPVETSITLSVGTASVSIGEVSAGAPIPGYALIGQQVQIDFDCPGSPCPSATQPLEISFRVDASRIPSGIDENNLAVLRDGVAVPACTGGPGIASPDPCVSVRELFGDGDIGITILTSQASLWSFASTTCAPAPLTCPDPGKGVLLVKRTTGDPSATKLLWKWLKGTINTPTEFGNPLDGTSYAVCVYDGSELVESHQVAPGGTCGASPCWKQLGTKGFGYKNTDGNDAGITKLLLKSGTGKAKILVKGKGASLIVPTSDPIYAQTSPVTVQLVTSGGNCWDASYPGPAKKSTASQFKDIIP